nr:PREDICTED: uncharacterized protein LOC103562253 [Equus przewalskii]
MTRCFHGNCSAREKRPQRAPRSPPGGLDTCAGGYGDTRRGGARCGPATRSATGASLPHPRPSGARSWCSTGALDPYLSPPSEAPATRQRPRSGPASPAPGRGGRPAYSALRHRAQRSALRGSSGRSSYGGTNGSKRELPPGPSYGLGRRSRGEGVRSASRRAFREWTSKVYGGGANEGPRKQRTWDSRTTGSAQRNRGYRS